jgi:hemerythrin-like metal-binding protein
MGFFNWMRKPANSDVIYSVMNDDHVELYRLVGELQENITKRCNGETERSLQEIDVLASIQKLIDKAAEHFDREDALMEQYRYPERREHRGEHAMLLCSIETYSSNLVSAGHPITKEVVQYLKDWLTNHIRTADRRLDRFLTSAVRKTGTPEPLGSGTSEAGWTAGNTLLWASFHDTVARETVVGNRQQSRNGIQAMEDRARRERSRERRGDIKGKLADDSRQMRALYYE